VAVFFVVSGYLITSLMIEEWDRAGGIDRRQFWLRRGRRLLPALYVMLLVVCTWAVLFVPDALDRLRSDVIAALLYVTNWWYIVDGQNYFESLGRPPAAAPLVAGRRGQWYLIWPFAFVFAMRRAGGAVHRLVVPLLAVAAASALWMAILFGATGDISRVYYGTDTHLSGLLIGAAAAMCWRPAVADGRGAPPRPRRRRWRHRLVLLVVTMLQWDPTPPSSTAAGSSSWPCCRSWWWRRPSIPAPGSSAASVHPALRWIGMRSYAIYLWHWPVVVLSANATSGGPAGHGAAVDGAHAGPGRAQLSARRVADPARGADPLVPAAAHGRGAGPLGAVEPAQLAGLAVVFVVGGLGVRLANAEKVDIAVGAPRQVLAVPPSTPRRGAGRRRDRPSPSRHVAVVGDSQPPPSCATHRPGSAST
jgi:peptidoglycan/LPS O-acetylase OafA/YrhL